jgi:inner membrane protein
MTARTHDLFGFASLLTAAALFPQSSMTLPTLMTSVVGNVVGALIPDMDQASNRLWDLLPGGNWVGKVFRHLFIGHRTISHSILGAVLLFKLLDFGLPKIFNPTTVDVHVLLVSIMIGFVSHLVADSLTKEGIPLFFPFSIKIGFPPIKFMRVTTGSFVENWVVLPAIVGYILWIVQQNQEAFLTLFRNIKA